MVTALESYQGKQQECDKVWLIEDSYYEEYNAAPKTKHFDRGSKILLSTMKRLCCKNDLSPERIEGAGLYIGTQFSSINSVEAFDIKSLEDSPLSVNPTLFPDTVLNAYACKLGIEFHMENQTYTVANGISSSLDAIGIAYESILSGKCEYAVAGGIDEWGEIQEYSYRDNKKVVEATGLATLELVEPEFAKGKNYLQLLSYQKKNVKIDRKLSADSIVELVQGEIEKFMDSAQKVDVYVSSNLSQDEERELFQCVEEKYSFTIDLHYSDEVYMGATGIIDIVTASKTQDKDSEFAIILNLNKSVLSSLVIKL